MVVLYSIPPFSGNTYIVFPSDSPLSNGGGVLPPLPPLSDGGGVLSPDPP